MRAIADAASDMDVEHLCAGLSAFMPLMPKGGLMLYILSYEKLLQERRGNQQHYWCWHHVCTGTPRAGTAWHGVFSNPCACTFWALPEWEPSTCTHGDAKDETWLYEQTERGNCWAARNNLKLTAESLKDTGSGGKIIRSEMRRRCRRRARGKEVGASEAGPAPSAVNSGKA